MSPAFTIPPAPAESRARAVHALDRIDDLLDRLDAAALELREHLDPPPKDDNAADHP